MLKSFNTGQPASTSEAEVSTLSKDPIKERDVYDLFETFKDDFSVGARI